jgi:MarR family transcriptional regulator for hemolysin
VTSALLHAGRQWRRLAQEEMAGLGISEARAATLLWVGRLGGGVRQVMLASYVGIEGTSLVRLLDQLSVLGLLQRRGDPGDRRANTVWLTPEGERMVERIEAALSDLRQRVLRDINDADIEATLHVLDALDRASADSRAQQVGKA